MKQGRTWAACFLFAALVGPALAETAPPLSGQEALSWLQRINQASRALNFSGVFVYQSRGRTESSRVTHVVDAAGIHERLESLTGPAREIVRNNDEVRCFLPEDRLVIIDRAEVGRFPGRFTTTLSGLLDFYSIRLGSISRVAGHEAQIVLLEPRDNMRYGHELWVDLPTGLLLRARMLGENGEVVEQFSFKEVTIGSGVDVEKVKSRYSRASDWKVVNARGQEVRSEEVNWVFRGLPSGFRQVSHVRRPVKRDGPEAYHSVFSDGLATVSVFVEPIVKRPMSVPPSTGAAGSMGIYKRSLGEYQVTAIGEVPIAALKRVAEGVELRRK